MNSKTKVFRILTLALWVMAFASSFMPRHEAFYHAFAALTAFSASMLIYSSRDTQGHYRNIAQAYMTGSAVWGLEELLRTLDMLTGGNELLITIADNISYIPLLFFSGGLLLMAQSEYNKLHFERVALHTFAISFFSFMIVQKLVLFHYGGIRVSGISMLGYMIYFFIAVFTITLIISIFMQTNFRGHTFGTNCSGVMLTLYCLLELDRLYRTMSNGDSRWLFFEPVGLLGLVVYSWAQSDPSLINRQIEPAELKPDEQVKNLYIWGNSAGFLIIGVLLYAARFFDTRDLYLLIIAVLSYSMLFKSLQARVYNELRIEQQKKENIRLEEMVEEKTRELRKAYEELQMISSTDALTGLYNRRYGKELLHRLADEKKTFAFMLMDLDHFKQVNDTYGHDIGDQVLFEVGRRLNSLEPGAVTAVRIGGDEFVLILEAQEGADIRAAAGRIAEELCVLMDEPVKTDEADIVPTACTGIGIWPDDAADIDSLYQITDEAMYGIKHNSNKSSYSFINESQAEQK